MGDREFKKFLSVSKKAKRERLKAVTLRSKVRLYNINNKLLYIIYSSLSKIGVIRRVTHIETVEDEYRKLPDIERVQNNNIMFDVEVTTHKRTYLNVENFMRKGKIVKSIDRSSAVQVYVGVPKEEIFFRLNVNEPFQAVKGLPNYVFRYNLDERFLMNILGEEVIPVRKDYKLDFTSLRSLKMERIVDTDLVNFEMDMQMRSRIGDEFRRYMKEEFKLSSVLSVLIRHI